MTKDKGTVLGAKYVDRVTGFVGMATARAEYLGNTPDVRLTAETGQDELKERWVTESRIEKHGGDSSTGFTA